MIISLFMLSCCLMSAGLMTVQTQKISDKVTDSIIMIGYIGCLITAVANLAGLQ